MVNTDVEELKETKKSKEETETITMEQLREGLRAMLVLESFEKEFGKMPHPLRIFKCRRWLHELETFKKGFEIGQKYTWKIMEKIRRE